MKIPSLQELVPTGKGVAWLLGAAISMFLAGMGFTTQVSQYRTLPEAVDSLEVTVAKNVQEIQQLQASVDQTARELRRIRCLSRLAATGQTVNPLSIDEVCP